MCVNVSELKVFLVATVRVGTDGCRGLDVVHYG